MKNRKHWEKQYEKPVGQIPWEIGKPPAELVRVLKTGQVKPGKALDVACGSGNYGIFLSEKGFRVTGVDVSENALRMARRKARSAKTKIKFVHADALSLSKVLSGTFDFVLDYSFLHHVPFLKTRAYAAQFFRLLKPGGKLLLVCYSTVDSKGKRTKVGKYGNAMVYRTKEEVLQAYRKLHLVQYGPARIGKRSQHHGHAFLFEKPSFLEENHHEGTTG